MKILEHVFERRTQEVMKVNDMQFRFMLSKGTVDTLFRVRMLQEKKKLYMWFVDLEEEFDWMSREVIKTLVAAVMQWYDGMRTRVRV